MKRVTEAEAKERLDEILDEAQREPLVIHRLERDMAVVLSIGEYERLRTANVQAFLDLRNQVAAEAALNGLSEQQLADLLRNDEA
jgi:PHD/YefM family antitoxin component YafN of YafNO toxin-antitoxin module